MAVSIGYIFSHRPTTKPVAMSVATVLAIVATFARLMAATSWSHGVMAVPIANSNGYVTAVEKNW